MMNFNATWAQPIDLVDGTSLGLTYYVKEITQIPENPGAYVFARVHSGKVTPLYIGESANLRKRIDQHFKKNVRLMNSLKKAPSGKLVFLYCTIRTNSDKRRDAMLALLQKALIEHALSEGHQLLNLQLTKTPFHTISFTGNRSSEQVAPRLMYVQ